MRARVLICLSFLLALKCLLAQTATATLGGTVDDGSGKSVPGATVTLTDVATSRQRTFTTNDNGAYSFVLLEPSTYALEVRATGFAAYRREAIHLEVGQNGTADVSLKLGAVSETVTVSENVQQLEVASAALGAMVDRSTINDLPLNGRNAYQLAALSSNVTTSPGARSIQYVTGVSAIAWVQYSINGGRELTNEILVDGAPITVKADNQPIFQPSPDMIQEFRVQTNSYSAEYGRTGGGTLNFSSRSGSNDFHGTLWEFVRNNKFDAPSFFANATNAGTQKLRFNQFGGNFGGPLLKNKLFFFTNVEAFRVRQAAVAQSTVPLPAEKKGIFTGVPYLIYMPGPVASRVPFQNNTIPQSSINSVGAALAANYPDPNRPGLSNNYVTNEPFLTNTSQVTARFDYRLTETQQIFVRYTREDDQTIDDGPFPGNIASPNVFGHLDGHPRNLVADYVKTINPRLVAHGNLAWTRSTLDRSILSNLFDPATLGFPSYIANASGDSHVFPTVTATGYQALGPVRNDGRSYNTQDNYMAAGDVNWIRGAHQMKFGGAWRVYRISLFRADAPAGNYTFNRFFTAKTATDSTSGDTIASMLLGIPNAGFLALVPSLAVESKYFGVYAQDDWKVSRKLSVNFGLRWESDGPNTERFNRLTNFNPSGQFPVSVNFTFPATLNIPARTGQLPGTVVFLGRAGNSQRNQSPWDMNNFGPRVGIAYKLNDKTVLRAGAAIFYSSQSGGGVSAQSYAAVTEIPVTTYVASLDNGITPTPGTSLSNPFPSGIVQAPGTSLGALTGYGQGTLAARFRFIHNPMVPQWNFNIQRELPWKLLAEAGYAGSAGIGLLGGTTDFNQISAAVRAYGPATLNTVVSNPFLTLPPAQQPPAGSINSQPTISIAQLLRPFPQFGQVQSYFENDAHSTYHALNLRIQRRFTEALNFQAGYTFSKLITDISAIQTTATVQIPNFQDNNNRKLDKGLSTFDTRNRFVSSLTYALPFGQGRRWANYKGLVNQIIGQWTFNSILSAQEGLPLYIAAPVPAGQLGLSVTNLRPNLIGDPNAVQQTIKKWFNTAAFQQPPSFGVGNSPQTLPNTRGPGSLVLDLSLHKQFAITERFRLQFRFEAFNAINHPNFGLPGPILGTANFGVISTTEAPRQLQVALKLSF